jgi:hypothetical protein
MTVDFAPLHRRLTLDYASTNRLLGFDSKVRLKRTMHRLTARILLSLLLVSAFAPVALAFSAPLPQHACCVRKAHHCHESATPESGQRSIGAQDCCNHDCCRAVTTSQWAHPQSQADGSFAHDIQSYLGLSSPSSPNGEVSRFQSARAPPSC